jgi:MFS transporter, OFA family, oxalate/formate antiporter
MASLANVGGGSALRATPSSRSVGRWLKVVGGVAAMMAIAAAPLAWPLIRSARGADLAESLAAAENAFAFFVLAETTFVPLEGWLGDRCPRWILVGAGLVLVAVGVVAGGAGGGGHVRVQWSALGGVGAGLAYGGTVAKALRAFTDRKALCVGVTAAACLGVLVLGLGALAALSSARALPVLVLLGAGQAVVILIATVFILYPPPARPPPDW